MFVREAENATLEIAGRFLPRFPVPHFQRLPLPCACVVLIEVIYLYICRIIRRDSHKQVQNGTTNRNWPRSHRILFYNNFKALIFYVYILIIALFTF